MPQTSIAYFASSFQTGVYSTSVVLVRRSSVFVPWRGDLGLIAWRVCLDALVVWFRRELALSRKSFRSCSLSSCARLFASRPRWTAPTMLECGGRRTRTSRRTGAASARRRTWLPRRRPARRPSWRDLGETEKRAMFVCAFACETWHTFAMQAFVVAIIQVSKRLRAAPREARARRTSWRHHTGVSRRRWPRHRSECIPVN